jgi:aldehyde dehydrogenase (NAD+)
LLVKLFTQQLQSTWYYSINQTPTLLELGGKSPCIVDDTIDPLIAAKRIAWGKVFNCGQTCVAPDFVLVDEKIAAAFKKALGESFVEMIGDASTSKVYSRIVSDRHFDRLTQILKKQLLVSGSKLEFGGSSRKEDRFIEPTVVSLTNGNVDENPMLQEELFGPFLPVITFSNLDDAITTAKKMYVYPNVVVKIHCRCIHFQTTSKILRKYLRKSMLEMRLQMIQL